MAHLARTNKTISTPCFAALWRKLDCLYPLLNALPSSVINLSSRWVCIRSSSFFFFSFLFPRVDNKLLQRLLRHPTLEDWSRPLYYGAFVRSVTYDPQRSGMYHPYINDSRNGVDRSFMYDILASLCIHSGSGPSSPLAIYPFPNLTHAAVVWRLAAPETFLAWNLLLSPSLLSASNISPPDPLCVHEHQHRHVLLEWLFALQARCPLLEHLHSEPRWGAIMALHPAANAENSIPCFANLRSLSAILPGAYSLRFVDSTAVQPRLRRLNLKFAPSSVMPESLGDEFYPSLETLEIEAYQQKCSEYLTLFAPRPPPCLTTLTLTCLSLEQPTSEFFSTVARAAPHLTLRKLSLSFHPNYNPSARTTLTDLAPLFVFEELRELRIQAGNPFHIPSAALDTLGAAFPEMRVLHLNSPGVEEGGDVMGATFTWSAVVALAKTCPALREVSLPLDFESLHLVETENNSAPRSPTATATQEETFLNLQSFLLNDIPLSTMPPPLSTPLTTVNQNPSQHPPLPPPTAPTISSPLQPPLTEFVSNARDRSRSRSRSTRDSLQNPQYAALASLVQRVFPRAKLGLHISRFEQLGRDGLERWERFEGSWRKRRKAVG